MQAKVMDFVEVDIHITLTHVRSCCHTECGQKYLKLSNVQTPDLQIQLWRERQIFKQVVGTVDVITQIDG